MPPDCQSSNLIYIGRFGKGDRTRNFITYESLLALRFWISNSGILLLESFLLHGAVPAGVLSPASIAGIAGVVSLDISLVDLAGFSDPEHSGGTVEVVRHRDIIEDADNILDLLVTLHVSNHVGLISEGYPTGLCYCYPHQRCHWDPVGFGWE